MLNLELNDTGGSDSAPYGENIKLLVDEVQRRQLLAITPHRAIEEETEDHRTSEGNLRVGDGGGQGYQCAEVYRIILRRRVPLPMDGLWESD